MDARRTSEGDCVGDPRAFPNGHDLVGLERPDRVDVATRPFDADPADFGFRAETEGRRQLALGTVARPGLHELPSPRVAAQRHFDARANPVAIRPRADRPDADGVVAIAAVV